MNITTYVYQIEGQGITTFGAFKISYSGSSKQTLNEIESKLSQLKSALHNQGLEFTISKTIEASTTNPQEEANQEVPLLNDQNLSKHIQSIVATRFPKSP